MANDLHDWQAAMVAQITRLDDNQTKLTETQSNTAILLERLKNGLDSVRDDLRDHQAREDRRPAIVSGWLNGWGAVAGAAVVLLCSGSALVVSIVSVVLTHLR